MKIILLQDIVKIGRRNEVKNVPDGYAQNFLIPQKKAVVATSEAIKKARLTAQQQEDRDAIQKGLLARAVQEIEGKEIVIAAKANEKGHLFAGIDARRVAEEIEQQLNHTLPEQAIALGQTIKEVGQYSVNIAIGEQKAKVVAIVTAAG